MSVTKTIFLIIIFLISCFSSIGLTTLTAGFIIPHYSINVNAPTFANVEIPFVITASASSLVDVITKID